MRKTHHFKLLPVLALGFGLSGCGEIATRFSGLDLDLRNTVGGLDTSNAARQATLARPSPDAQGVISYPNYQVAIAETGDTVETVATRVGGNVGDIARFNGLRPDDILNRGEVIALPRVVTASAATAPRDIREIATTAINNAPQQAPLEQAATRRIDGPEPVRHQVERGETAYSIARLYDVSVTALAEWNGLGTNLDVREGQYLLVPVIDKSAQPQAAAVTATAPGAGSATPLPPSASKPLPEPVQAVKKPATPDLGEAKVETVAAATAVVAPKPSAFLQPVSGKILRPYQKRKNDGIGIAASEGTQVKAASDGIVAAITRDTDEVPILVLRHSDNVLTVYANIADISVKKGESVTRGQSIAKVGPGNPSFLHFEIREGFDSVNPAKYLK